MRFAYPWVFITHVNPPRIGLDYYFYASRFLVTGIQIYKGTKIKVTAHDAISRPLHMRKWSNLYQINLYTLYAWFQALNLKIR